MATDSLKQPNQRLRGRYFFESIGSPKVVLAPMVDHSEFAWRMLSRSFMPSTSDASGSTLLAYTPMLHAKLFGELPKYRLESFESHRGMSSGKKFKDQEKASLDTVGSEQPYLDGNPAYDRPLFTQFCANDPERFLEAAKIVAPFCDAVDLNLGCPQGIAKKGNYGAFLQEQRPLIFEMINKLHRDLQVPVTAKIRLQATREDTLAYAKMVLEAGADVLTVHGRQRHQKGQLTGLADWSAIRHLRDNLPPETVLIANGNILHFDDIATCLEATGADAVMSAETNLYDPAIFAPPPTPGREGTEYWRGLDGKGGWRLDAVMRRYLDIIYIYVLECDPPQRAPLSSSGGANEAPAPAIAPIATVPSQFRRSPNVCFMKGHLYKLLRPLLTKFTDIRDVVNHAEPGNMAAFENVLHQVEKVTAKALAEYEGGNESVAEHTRRPYTADERRIWRPWWVCQSHLRPLQDTANEAAPSRKKDKPAYAKGFDPLDMGLGLSPEDIPVAG